MSQINRLRAAEIANGNLINADDINAELNQLVSESNTQDTRLVSVETGTLYSVATDPASPTNGKLWYNTTDHKIRARVNGETQNVGEAGTLPLGYQAKAGRKYSLPFINTAVFNGATANRLCFFPLIVPRGAYTKIGLHIYSAHGSNARIGLYKSDSNGFPATLLIDGGEVSCATTGEKQVSVAAQNLSAGQLYWGAVAFQGTPTPYVVSQDTHANPLRTLLGTTNSAFNQALGSAFYQSHTYGVLPASVGTLTECTFYECPIVHVEI